MAARFGEHLVGWLEAYGVETVFGIPGVHNVELYRGLSGSRIRHVTPRHEQGAGFMADGYARVTGRPGVCFVITGPGLTNIATAVSQALQDSIPMLVISSVNARADLGHHAGKLHELRDQAHLASSLFSFSHTLLSPDGLPGVLARAFALFEGGRPGPVHIEIPLDVLGGTVDGPPPRRPAPLARPVPGDAALAEAAEALNGAERPLLLVGGGARLAAGPVCRLAERLDAPAVTTVNARGLLPKGHRLSVPASPSLEAVRHLLAGSDVVLAAGTEFGQTDYDMYARGAFEMPGRLVRIDIDARQIVRNRIPDLPLIGDAAATLAALAQRVAGRERGGAGRAAAARKAAWEELTPAMRRGTAFLDDIAQTLPGARIVGDSTHAIYAGNLFFGAAFPGAWFNSATGYGTLGYALPAAIGAWLGDPGAPVVCLAGDGGLQFMLAELGSAIDAGTPVIVLVWNNRGYGEIRRTMEERGIAPLGVDLATPDFVAIACAYGLAAERLRERAELKRALREAAARSIPTLIEIDEAVALG